MAIQWHANKHFWFINLSWRRNLLLCEIWVSLCVQFLCNRSNNSKYWLNTPWNCTSQQNFELGRKKATIFAKKNSTKNNNDILYDLRRERHTVNTCSGCVEDTLRRCPCFLTAIDICSAKKGKKEKEGRHTRWPEWHPAWVSVYVCVCEWVWGHIHWLCLAK